MNIQFLGAHDNLAGICCAAGARERLRKAVKENRRDNLSMRWTALILEARSTRRPGMFFTIRLHPVISFTKL